MSATLGNGNITFGDGTVQSTAARIQNKVSLSNALYDIPSWVKYIKLFVSGQSLSGTDSLLLRLGTSNSTYATTGYISSSGVNTNAPSFGTYSNTTGFIIHVGNGAYTLANGGQISLVKHSSTVWTCSHLVGTSTGRVVSGGGVVDIGGPLVAAQFFASGSNTIDGIGYIKAIYMG